MAEPTTPWWSNLLAIILTAIVSVLGTAYYFTGGGLPSVGMGAPSGVGSLIESILAYLPHILLLFGVIADALTWEGVYAIPSGFGILSIFLNYGMRYFWDMLAVILQRTIGLFSGQAGAFPAVPEAVAARQAAQRAAQRGGRATGEFYGNYDGCEVQGFKWARSPYAPQTLVFTATVFLYYIFDLINNRGWSQASVAIAMFGVFYIAQVFVIGDCPAEPGSVEINRWVKGLIGFIEGALFGGVSYSIMQSYAPERLPSSALSIFPRMTASQLTPGKNGTMVDSNGNPYVCMPNGQCVPDLSTTEARKSFADLAGETLGTGKAAVPADCPASGSST